MGASIAPILVAALNMPVASALSFFGNHSATVFMLAGKLPASPKAETEPGQNKSYKCEAFGYCCVKHTENTPDNY